MTKKEKLYFKFQRNPVSLSFQEIEKILLDLGFIKIEAKGSHKKFKHTLLERDIIVPVHNQDCKDFYKKMIYKTIKNILI